ncbi:glycosyltransferase [Fimbriiglobus ruber]|uniref:Glycosyl transferase n=1 Tax=Fimbriiglobus ruber TaxID=1908690 RepID=A0A225E9A1_9BACT|nr:glycosyltransferase [Fimbriiglobus ruber]OWK46636.1 Glycosyl transferase [Fimbriiglobus ruber]
MPRIFYLASDLGPTGPAKLVSLLAPALPRDRYECAVGAVKGAGESFAEGLRKADIRVDTFPLRHPADWNGLRTLRTAVAAFRPDVIHALGPVATLLARWLLLPWRGAGAGAKLVVSAVDRSPGGCSGWLTSHAARAADRIVAASVTEAARYAGFGIDPVRVVLIPPAVATPYETDGAAFRRSLDIPPDGRLILAAGRFDAAAGLKTAVWAFDVVKYAAPNLYLVLVGDGPERERLTRFGKALGFDDYRVRFAGTRPDVPALLTQAEIVWVTHTHGGTNVALEAMAAGKPVLAVRTPDLAEVVEDGVTGKLVAATDRVQLAAFTNEWLEHPEAARAFGAAGRARVADRFSVGTLAARHAALYDGVLAT